MTDFKDVATPAGITKFPNSRFGIVELKSAVSYEQLGPDAAVKKQYIETIKTTLETTITTKTNELQTAINAVLGEDPGQLIATLDTIQEIAAALNNDNDAFGTLSGLITQEKDRAMLAEATLTTDLNNEIARATQAETTLTTDLNNEIARAQAAENTLTTDLNNEIVRAQDAENTLNNAILSEQYRAESIEAKKLDLAGGDMTGTLKIGDDGSGNETSHYVYLGDSWRIQAISNALTFQHSNDGTTWDIGIPFIVSDDVIA